ncbi:hypothetical protein E1262_26650 [Jiangella aurantiaca]|uniref:DUF4386 family protein n=1 Tax=Jiangella aurantiaca TaxID=2530373 RepID=A0A4R5A2Z0_9ACTN|nr:hypothetical protein [Jiangella aurantiaca]TDD64939.1 hypothetical protein E1262_26650 [Jiangella aurantiaca]
MTSDTPLERHRSLRRAALLTAGLGAAHAVLLLLSYALLSGVPEPDSSDAEIVAFYSSSDRRLLVLVGLYLMPFAGIAFLWFIVALRTWIAHSVARENALISNVQLVSGIVFIALFFAGAGATATLATSVEFADAQIDPVTARQFPQYGNSLLFVFAMRMAAMFVITTSKIGRSAGILPRWFTWTGFGVGLFLLLSVSFYPALVVVFPVWLLMLSGLLLLRARRIPVDAALTRVQPR